ncbi:MAG: stage III sporulation protein AF [Christensenellales bacterium]|jgi:stage III sporulation protein AF
MGAWLVSVAAVVALSVLLDIVVPEGETNKYIKGIFALITVFVIIAPVITFIERDYSIEDLFTANTALNDAFIRQTESDLSEIKNDAIEKALSDIGYKDTSVRIYLNYDNKIDFVTVDINNLSIDKDKPHININNDIKSIVANFLNIDKEKVVIYGHYTG